MLTYIISIFFTSMDVTFHESESYFKKSLSDANKLSSTDHIDHHLDNSASSSDNLFVPILVPEHINSILDLLPKSQIWQSLLQESRDS